MNSDVKKRTSLKKPMSNKYGFSNLLLSAKKLIILDNGKEDRRAIEKIFTIRNKYDDSVDGRYPGGARDFGFPNGDDLRIIAYYFVPATSNGFESEEGERGRRKAHFINLKKIDEEEEKGNVECWICKKTIRGKKEGFIEGDYVPKNFGNPKQYPSMHVNCFSKNGTKLKKWFQSWEKRETKRDLKMFEDAKKASEKGGTVSAGHSDGEGDDRIHQAIRVFFLKI